MSAWHKKELSKRIIHWYEGRKRDLPWRNTIDPYKIWLSEIILQQTRVNQGLPYYLRFIEKYPTIQALANASEQEVLRLWQGLGYYSRARNLHRCAKEVVINYKGIFPSDFDALKKLPGIGDYTAAAIASVCFKQAVAVVDGNVYRVLARIAGIETPINSTGGKKEFFDFANEIISREHPDIHNQAMMEFGALHCKPQNPLCEECIFSKNCEANKGGLQNLLPVKEKKTKIKKRYFYYLVWRKGKSLALRKREGKDIWNGLFDFPLIEKSKPASEKQLLAELGNTSFEMTDIYKHVLSHQVIYARFLLMENASVKKAEKYYSAVRVGELPKPVLISRFLKDYGYLE